jgi:hypothetical protein
MKKLLITLAVAGAMTFAIGEWFSVTRNEPLVAQPVDLTHPIGGVFESVSFHLGRDSDVLAAVQSDRYGEKHSYVRLIETDDAVLLNGEEGAEFVCSDLLTPFVQKNRLGTYSLHEMDRKLLAHRGQTIQAAVLVPRFDTEPGLCDGMRWNPSSKEVYLNGKAVYFFVPSGKGYAGTLDSWRTIGEG